MLCNGKACSTTEERDANNAGHIRMRMQRVRLAGPGAVQFRAAAVRRVRHEPHALAVAVAGRARRQPADSRVVRSRPARQARARPWVAQDADQAIGAPGGSPTPRSPEGMRRWRVAPARPWSSSRGPRRTRGPLPGFARGGATVGGLFFSPIADHCARFCTLALDKNPRCRATLASWHKSSRRPRPRSIIGNTGRAEKKLRRWPPPSR